MKSWLDMTPEEFQAASDKIQALEPFEAGVLTGEKLDALADFVLERVNLLSFLHSLVGRFESLHDKIPGGAPIADAWKAHMQRALVAMHKELLPKFSKQEPI